MHRNASFVKFEADIHNINLLPTKAPHWHTHQARFIVTDDDVDAIVKIWPEEWRGPLTEPLLEDLNAEEPPIHQVNGEYQEGDDSQVDPSKENMEDDDVMEDLDMHPSAHPHAEDQT